MKLCVSDSEERELGVGAGVNATMLSETLAIISLAESAEGRFGAKKTRCGRLCGGMFRG